MIFTLQSVLHRCACIAIISENKEIQEREGQGCNIIVNPWKVVHIQKHVITGKADGRLSEFLGKYILSLTCFGSKGEVWPDQTSF